MRGERSVNTVLWLCVGAYIFITCILPLPYFNKVEAYSFCPPGGVPVDVNGPSDNSSPSSPYNWSGNVVPK